MAFIRRLDSRIIFKCIVVPALLLSVIFDKNFLQWVAVAAVALWLLAILSVTASERILRRRRRRAEKQIPCESTHAREIDPSMKSESDSALFLIRQINYRITEQLKASYPMVAWLWVKRPGVEDLCKGGTWRIRVSHTEPFNYADVEISKTGELRITMLQAVALSDVPVSLELCESDDLKQEELLERCDVKAWYLGDGCAAIAALIDDLNTQGHRRLLIHEDGEVVVGNEKNGQVVDKIHGFPPRHAWEEFSQLLCEDDIASAIQTDGLALSW